MKLAYSSKVGAALLLAASSMVGLASGCGRSPEALAAAYRPSDDAARKALDDALAAWRRGDRPDALASATPSVQVADSQWAAGARLEGYTILDRDAPADDQPAWFHVDLTFKKPAGPTHARFHVVGNDPLWVYRDVDYAKFMNMDGGPTPPKKRRR